MFPENQKSPKLIQYVRRSSMNLSPFSWIAYWEEELLLSSYLPSVYLPTFRLIGDICSSFQADLSVWLDGVIDYDCHFR
jgi:hypothetical protein